MVIIGRKRVIFTLHRDFGDTALHAEMLMAISDTDCCFADLFCAAGGDDCFL